MQENGLKKIRTIVSEVSSFLGSVSVWFYKLSKIIKTEDDDT